MFKIKLMPQDKKFFDLFNSLSGVLNEMSDEFVLFLENYNDNSVHLEKIKNLEHQGNKFASDLMKELLSNFVTPMDREDIHSLTDLMRTIISHMRAATMYFVLYRIHKMNPHAVLLAKSLNSAVKELTLLISKLDNMSELEKLSQHIDEIRELENKGDDIFRDAIRELFADDNANPLDVIKWKDIYNRMEHAIDKCSDSGNIILGIILKYA